ncbi:tRNA (guanosine(46)-N7)-methyltransferase TrmB [Afifella pfennigii]|uniref:tRNA (guanosine(46)-N7)-methyltransferase TrmB n=1 Tax=Afifella pfennigii TaxID=209897 RepID=UPI000478B337|nr:tRNA (guanosine(46)-N7)-methyltransferase TrmB [Afifella pfennigii]
MVRGERRDSFFGRRKGKRLTAARQALMEECLPELAVDIARPAPEHLAALFAVPVVEVRLEIGFGGGEHLLHRARQNPDIGFIGIEPFQNGLAKAVAAIEAEGLENVRLYGADAGPFLDWLPEGSLAGIDLLYPDPWPKKRHFKRRFVNQANLARLWRALEPGGHFRFATDIASYADWTMVEAAKHGGFAFLAERAQDWRRPFPDWPGTRYEAKAIGEGRRPVYFTFEKCRRASRGDKLR